jgi:hypothetical protein
MAAAALLLAIHVASIANAPRTAVEWRTGVEQLDAEVIRFLLDREITIAATSLNGSSSGYWEAYRLTFSSGERVRVHPILHMPRIDRYRTALKEAQRAAIVTTAPEMVSSVLEQEGIAFETETVGSMTILHGFDKEELDRRKLMDYRRRLDE